MCNSRIYGISIYDCVHTRNLRGDFVGILDLLEVIICNFARAAPEPVTWMQIALAGANHWGAARGCYDYNFMYILCIYVILFAYIPYLFISIILYSMFSSPIFFCYQ